MRGTLLVAMLFLSLFGKIHCSNNHQFLVAICRQLEAIIRIAESLAKMTLSPFALENHIDESLRLFQVSTLDAAMSGNLAGEEDSSTATLMVSLTLLSGAEGFSTEGEQEEVRRVERQLKSRFPIGSQVSEQRILEDFKRQKYSERAIQTVLMIMLRRGELQHRLQRKVLFRVR